MSTFYVTGGTLRHDAPSYVERQADRAIFEGLLKGEFCYVLTSRQMGKSSLMVRTVNRLRHRGFHVAAVDLTAIGLNLTPEQWYDGLATRIGRQLRLEDPLEQFWIAQQRLNPLQRFMASLQEIVLPQMRQEHDDGRIIIFIDEIDTVRSLPFSTDEFFSAIRECYNRRSSEPEFNRLTFCLLGVAAPTELIRDNRTTPFNIGQRIELTDFTREEALPLAKGLVPFTQGCAKDKEALTDPQQTSMELLDRVLYWTSGHPYLTQRLCRAITETECPDGTRNEALVDSLCHNLFVCPRARERDDNLIFVRERLLRSEAHLDTLLSLYEQVRNGSAIPDDENNDAINHLRLAGIIRAEHGLLQIRNRIYHHVFDQSWIEITRPDAELEMTNGDRLRIKGGTCTIGRAPTNEIVLADDKVSRRHALIQTQQRNEFWLIDLGSSNGTFLNGRRVTHPVLLCDQDLIEMGPFKMIFHQSDSPGTSISEDTASEGNNGHDHLVPCWMLLCDVDASTHLVYRPGDTRFRTAAKEQWPGSCRDVVKSNGAHFARFPGDGFLAYWPEANRPVHSIVLALHALKTLQLRISPSFRMILHYGAVAMETTALVDDQNLTGQDARFVLAMDQVAGSLGEPCFISEPARNKLKAHLSATVSGRHSLQGFEGQFLFFRI